MKKVSVFLCLMLSLVCLNTLSVKANQIALAGDSVDVGEELRNELQVKSSDNVIRIYNTSILISFAKHDGIDEILAGPDMLETFYAVKSSDDIWTYRREIDNSFVVIETDFVNDQALDACLSGEAVNYISSDVEVYNVFYLSGETCYTGTAIYYITNKGDYVHYFGGQHCTGEFLMPAEVFYELQEAIEEEISKNPYKNAGSYSNWNLSVYNLKSDAFDLSAESPFKKLKEEAKRQEQRMLWNGVSAGACLVTAGMVFAVIRKRKTKTE